MTRIIIRLSSIAILLSALTLIGLLPVRSDTGQKRKPQADLSYRSRTATHKMIVYSTEQSLRDQILDEGGQIIEDYESFALMKASTEAIDRISARMGAPTVRDDMNLVLLRAGIIDTTEGEGEYLRALAEPEASGEQLYLVQMVGPVKQEWRDQLEEHARVLAYIPNNAYLVRASDAGVAAINNLKSRFVQWSGLYRPAYKIAPEIAIDSDNTVSVTVQLARTDQVDASIYRISSFSPSPLVADPVNILSFTNIRLRVAASRLAEIARMSDVVWIEPWAQPELLDERQGLIVSGKVTGSQLDLPGYLDWLRGKGITSAPDFLVDVADSGIDAGNLDPEVLHEDFLDEGGLSRVIYARLLGQLITEGPPNDTIGHGTLDAAIVGGYNVKTGPPYLDSLGYSLGLGIHPFVRLGITKIFTPTYTGPNLAEMVDMMYRDGARISNNSWGANGNSYNTDAQIYDSLVRDARPSVDGNQEISVVFASGNKGANALSIPGTAKNVITVGASESIRPGTDGCLIDSSGADDFNSIIDFSSGGITDDGRVKPEIVAPGTHIQGAASQDPQYFGTGICGPRFVPTDQTLYTWSSGTSHATPAVSGAAAIVRQFFQQATGDAPSAAMIKAFLLSSATYLTGAGAGGNLPSQRQGWGLVNIGRALDDAPKQLIDQSQRLSSSGQTYTLTGSVADETKPLRITLCWTDAPGTPAGSSVVNNLDLQVEIGGVTFKGNHFAGGFSSEGGSADPLNNVESVWLPEGTSGDFTIRVIAANIAGDGVPGNSDSTDQDFALVVYNGRGDGNPPGGGGGGSDSPPAVKLQAPVGGERLMAGNLVRILWDASDDKGIETQKIEFSSDQGARYDVIATLGSAERSFDWKIPPIPTTKGKIRVTVLDGVNLPVSSSSPANFEVVAGPPDTTPPTLQIVAPNTNSIVGGGLHFLVKWKESDNVGVIRREIAFSTDNGDTFATISTIVAPSSGMDQQYDWTVPAALDTSKGKVRIKVFDGAGNFAEVTSGGKFEVWPAPFITDADFDEDVGKHGQLELFGRNFRKDDCEIYANGKKLKKLVFDEHCADSGVCKKVSINDPKIHKRVKKGKITMLVIKVMTTGQTSPEFQYKRKSPRS